MCRRAQVIPECVRYECLVPLWVLAGLDRAPDITLRAGGDAGGGAGTTLDPAASIGMRKKLKALLTAFSGKAAWHNFVARPGGGDGGEAGGGGGEADAEEEDGGGASGLFTEARTRVLLNETIRILPLDTGVSHKPPDSVVNHWYR